MDPEVERLKKKVENYPSPSSYNRLAELLKQNGQIDEAKAICNRSMKDFPRNGQAYVIVAQMHYELKQTSEAMGLLRQAVEGDPRCYGAHMLLSDIYLDAGHPGHAIKHLDYILKLRPKDQPAARKLESAKDMAAKRSAQSTTAPAPVTTAVPNPPSTASMPAAPSSPPPPPAPATHAMPAKRESGTIDLSSMSTGLTSIVNKKDIGLEDALSAPAAAAAPASKTPEDLLADYCQQKGVRCAIVADKHGRSLATQNLPPGLDDLVAALAREITELSNDSLGSIDAGGLVSWSVTAENGQVLSFNENEELSLIAIADSDIKMAMLELRARQTITEIGGS